MLKANKKNGGRILRRDLFCRSEQLLDLLDHLEESRVLSEVQSSNVLHSSPRRVARLASLGITKKNADCIGVFSCSRSLPAAAKHPA